MPARLRLLCKRCDEPFKPAKDDPVRCDACHAPQIDGVWPTDDDEPDPSPEAA